MVRSLQVDAEPIPGYRLVRYLGRGGVGEVWQVEAPGHVAKAVKMIPMDKTEALLKDRELQGLAKIRMIRHPYLLSIDRYEIIDGYIAIVMELADKSLADRFEECALKLSTGVPREELLRYIREAAEVLDVLSIEHGLQHLDIKPENLFLLSGHIKVADFGLVQPSRTELSQAALAFTPAYAPPELFHGKVAASADQYSLAVTYQELLTGRRPHLATSFRELIFQHDGGRPDVSMLPPGDQPIMLRALSKNLNERFASCSAFVDALTASGGMEANLALAQSNRLTKPSRPSFHPTQIVVPKLTTTPAGGVARPFVVRAPTMTAPLTPLPEVSTSSFRTFNGTLFAQDTSKANNRPSSVELRPQQDKIVSTFLAWIPMELYARKLRAFMDAMDAEIEGSPSREDTILRFRPLGAGWFGRRPNRSLFMRVETVADPRRPDSSVVEATVYSSHPRFHGPELNRSGLLLIRALKSFLMANEREACSVNTDAVKAEIWGESI